VTDPAVTAVIKPRQVPVTWDGIDELPMLAATTFACGVLGPGEIMLAIGQAAPPIFAGDPQEQERLINAIDSINARPVARVVMSPARAVELIASLQQAVNAHSQLTAESDKR
jgi:hypothetical protein